MGAASPLCESQTLPHTWSGFGDHEPLKKTKLVRLSLQFLHDSIPCAYLAIWVYVVSTSTMDCPVFLGRDSWMRFNTWSYRTLPLRRKSGRIILGELTFYHLGRARAHAFMIINSKSNRFYQVYSGKIAISLMPKPQGVPVALK